MAFYHINALMGYTLDSDDGTRLTAIFRDNSG